MFQNNEFISEQINILRGKVSGFEEQNSILVSVKDIDESFPCVILLMNKKEVPSFNIGDEVLIIFNSIEHKGYIIGLVYSSSPIDLKSNLEDEKIEIKMPEKPKVLNVSGKKIVIEADDEIHLQCGKSSILMDKQGKIIIRGTYLVSRSSGMNKIKGAAVGIN